MKWSLFAAYLFLLLLLSACTPQAQATPLATSTALPTAAATATPNPSPTPTPIPTLFGGYSVDKLAFSWSTHSDLHFASLDNKTNFDVTIAGKTHNNDYALGPYWSPDGKWVIFAYYANCIDSCGIHLVDVANRTDHLINIDQPYFSISNRSFLFSWNPQNDHFITTIPQSSTNDYFEKHKIVIVNTADLSVLDSGVRGFQPTFSPVNDDYVFMDCSWPSIKYYLIKDGSTQPTLIARVRWGNPFSCQVTPFIWSTNGKRIYFTAPHELQSANLDGSDQHVIIHTEQDLVDFRLNSISSDGKYMIITVGNGTTFWQAGYVDLENDKLTMMEKGTFLIWDRSGHLIALEGQVNGKDRFSVVDPLTGERTPVDFQIMKYFDVLQP